MILLKTLHRDIARYNQLDNEVCFYFFLIFYEETLTSFINHNNLYIILKDILFHKQKNEIFEIFLFCI